MAVKIPLRKAQKLKLTDRDRLEGLLYQLKKGDNRAFAEIVQVLDGWKGLKSWCHFRSQRFGLALFEEEDLHQIALLAVFQSVQRFKFNCPLCNAKFETRKQFLQHTFKKHGVIDCKPKVSIADYAVLSAFNEMRNELRKGKSQKYNPEQSVPVEEAYELGVPDSTESFYAVGELLTLAKKELNEKTFLILRLAAAGFTNAEIAHEAVVAGHYSTRSSASTGVTETLRRRSAFCMQFIGA